MDKLMLIQEATKWHGWFEKGQKSWSCVYHTTIFGSIVCSVAAGALLQVGGGNLSGYSAVLTSIAAALTSLAASGGFERKWRSNRHSRSRIDCLFIDMEADKADLDEIACRLKDIISTHDDEIIKGEQLGGRDSHDKMNGNRS